MTSPDEFVFRASAALFNVCVKRARKSAAPS
jgi:hypothetical protein